MKDKKETNDLEEIYTTLHRLNDKVSSEEVERKFETLKAIMEKYKKEPNPAEREVLEQEYFKVTKDTQIALINAMIKFLGEMLENKENGTQPKPTLKDQNSEATSFFSQVVGNLENTISAFSRIVDDVSISITGFKEDVTAFTEDLNDARERLLKSKKASIIKLDSYNKLIDIYTKIIKEEYGYYPDAKIKTIESTPSNPGYPIRKKNKHAKKVAEIFDEKVSNDLKMETDSLSEQIKVHEQKIKEALTKYHEKTRYLKEQKESPLIVKQIKVLCDIFVQEIPFLDKSKKQPINETECLLNYLEFSSTDKENNKHLTALYKKYRQEYGLPTRQMLYQLLLKQKAEYINELKNQEELIDKAFSNIEEIELNDELAFLLEHYTSEVNFIQSLIKNFEGKVIILVKEEPTIVELLRQYDTLIQQNNHIMTKLASESSMQIVSETTPTLNRIEITKKANAEVGEIKNKLTELLSQLISAQDEAEKNRLCELNIAKSNINQHISIMNTQLQTLLDGFKKSVICPKYVNNFQEQTKKLIEKATQEMEGLPNLPKEELIQNALSIQKELIELQKAIKKAIEFEEIFNTLQTQLLALATDRANLPFQFIDQQNFQELNDINSLLIDERSNYNQRSLLKMQEYKNSIESVREKQQELQKNFADRTKSREILSLNQLLEALGAFSTSSSSSDWTKLLGSELVLIKDNYLSCKINLTAFKEQAAQAISENVTKGNLSKLTIEDEGTTRVGNLFRALVEFFIAIGYSISRQERPRYNPQFFASQREKEFAGKVSAAYHEIMAVQLGLQEEQISIQPQLEISAKA